MMTRVRTLEDRLKSTGTVLRNRPSIADQVLAEIRQARQQPPADRKPQSEPRRD